MKTAIIFGGKSTEYEISCLSAFNVLENLRGHEVFKIGITKDGEWFFTSASNEDIKSGKWTEWDNIPVVIDFSEACENGLPFLLLKTERKFVLTSFSRYSTERTGRTERFRGF